MKSGWLLVVGLTVAAVRSTAAQGINPEAIYKDSCAQCHDEPQGRTPSKAALKDRSPDTILAALTNGSMSMQGLTLSVPEKRALAEYLSGKPFGAAASNPNACG